MTAVACSCDQKKYTEAFTLVTNGTLAEARAAKKELDRMHAACRAQPRCLKQHADAVERILAAFERAADPKRRAVLLLALNQMTFFFGAPQKRVDSVSEAIRAGIVDKSGEVREAARRLAGAWRLHEPLSSNKSEPAPAVRDMLHYVKDALEKHRPAGTLKHLDMMPPSIYKSLVFLFEKLTRGMFMESWVHRHPEFQISIPLRTYEDDVWLLQNVVDRHKVLAALWRGSVPSPDARQAFEDLEEMTRVRFDTTLERFGCTSAEREGVRKRILESQTDETQRALCTDLAMLCIGKGHPIEKVGTVIRELQAIINHTTRREPHLYSYFLLSATSERDAANMREPRDLLVFLSRIRDIHRAIDTFAAAFLDTHEREMQAFRDRLQKIKGAEDMWSPEYLADEEARAGRLAREMDECRSIAHHVWDWYAQLKSWHTPKPPEKYAALAYFVVKEVNFDNRRIMVPYGNKELSAFGGWKGQGSISYPGYCMRNEIWGEIIDKDLLYLLENCPDPIEYDDDSGHVSFSDVRIDPPLGMVREGFPRYCVVVSCEGDSFSDAHRSRLENAMSGIQTQGECELENIEYGAERGAGYALLSLGVSFEVPLQTVIDDLIVSANGFEPFLRFHFFATNTHKPDTHEIREYLDDIAQ